MAQKCKGLESCGYDVLQVEFYQDLTAECAPKCAQGTTRRHVK